MHLARLPGDVTTGAGVNRGMLCSALSREWPRHESFVVNTMSMMRVIEETGETRREVPPRFPDLFGFPQIGEVRLRLPPS